jgi:hypothetical protein
VLLVGVTVAATLFVSGARAATPNTQKVIDPGPPVAVKTKGETFFDRTFALGRTDGGRVVLSARPDGTGGVLIDDLIIVTVIGPDGNGGSVAHAFNDASCRVLRSRDPIDVTGITPSGASTVRVQLKDDCGGKRSAITPLWLVVNGQPTLLRSTPVVVSALPASPELATVDVPNVTAKLTEAATFNPIPGRLVTFRAGSSVICSALTDSDGVAACGGVAEFLTAVLNLGYSADFAGDPNYTGSTTRGALLTIGTTALPD